MNMLYTLMLNHEEIQNILKALSYAEESDVLPYETVARLYDYITDEIEVQRAAIEKAKNIKE